MDPRAVDLIRRLDLAPHPEGGFYRELYRSESLVRPGDGRGDRAAITTILFLLPQGTHSRWHRVGSDEVWHLYEGGPLELLVAAPELVSVQRVVLGPALVSDGPAHTVPAGWWQAARPRGAYAFLGCTVGPGFDFADFALLKDEPRATARLGALGAELLALA